MASQMNGELLLPAALPRAALLALQDAILPSEIPPRAELRLSITLDCSAISVRDLSKYLSFTDHVYGRLDPRGLRSYAQREPAHLRLTDVRRGSLELIIAQLLESSKNVIPVVVLYLLLKYLPEFLQSLASAYRDYEEARYTRTRRKNLREQVMSDDQLVPLSSRHKEQLVKFLDEMYIAEADTVPGARRLARRQVRRITLQVASSDGVRRLGGKSDK